MKIKKRTLKIIIVVILLIIAFFLIRPFFKAKDPYQFKGDKLYYSEKRGKPDFDMSLMAKNDTFDLYKVNFVSRNFLEYPTKIYGLLFMPHQEKNIPALVLLPGGGVNKENEARVATIIVKMGYAVLTIDQRGIGETDGNLLNMDDDFKVFAQGKEPIQHVSVYDALRTFDVLREIKGIVKNNIAMSGESMGGRYAMIATGIDKRIKGAVIISSAGFHVPNDPAKPYTPYLLSIDPDHYIADISPRPLFMFHGTNDTTVKLTDAQYTFSLAKEPKKFFIAQDCHHGYCDAMKDDFEKSLRELFGK